MELKVHVYDDKGKVKKTAKARTIELDFKTISSLFDLLKLEELKDDIEIVRAIAKVWEDLKGVIPRIFPDLTADEIDGLKAKEVIPVILVIIKESFLEILTIPTDPN